MVGLDDGRERRLVFGEDAELYDAARPSYPLALVDDLVEMVGGRRVDVGEFEQWSPGGAVPRR